METSFAASASGLRKAAATVTTFPFPHAPNTPSPNQKMKRLLLSLALACSTAFAADTQPSEASIKELLTLSDAPKLIDGMWAQIGGMIQQGINQSTQGQQITPAQQTAIEKYKTNSIAIMREELSWAKIEPMYVRIYQNSLNQDEIDGMIAFYKTPAGQAVIKKMPALMQQIMAEMPAMMGPLMQKMQPLAQQLAADMKAASEASTEPAK